MIKLMDERNKKLLGATLPLQELSFEVLDKTKKYVKNNYPDKCGKNSYGGEWYEPLRKDYVKIQGIITPINFPVFSDSKVGKEEAINNLLLRWKEKDNKGKEFSKCFKIIDLNDDNSTDSTTFEVKSFLKWKNLKEKERLAFIYNGIFWNYNKDENLQEAVERFLDNNINIKKFFEAESEIKYHEILNSKIAIDILFEEGALIINQKEKRAYCKNNEDCDYITNVWKSLAILGYFDFIEKVSFIDEREVKEIYSS